MAEKLNGPGFGARMAMAQQAGKLVEDSNQLWRKVRDRDEALRELLSYCTVCGTTNDPDDAVAAAYADVAARLRSTLDGEQ